LRLRTGPLAAGVLCRVVSMMLARAECPLDRLDDAMLLCDALCAYAPTHVSDGYLSCQVTVNERDLQLRVDGLSVSGARGLIADAVLPGVGNVLEHVTDELRVEQDPQQPARLLMSLSFA
jgi:serine/threonine-protein kinase RsbW